MPNKKEDLETLISIHKYRPGSFCRKGLSLINNVIEQSLSIRRIRKIYREIPFSEDPFQFMETALKSIDISYQISHRDERAIPFSGPAIVVSNHPFGGIDGIILALALSRVRKDIKILVNYFLMNIPDMRPLFFAVDPFGKRSSIHTNMVSLGRAVRWVKKGGLLVVFPAGEVSHITWKNFKIEDPVWSDTLSRLVHITRAPVLPVYFYGRNSYAFQTAGLIHSRLRTALLPRELLKKKGAKIKLKIGNLIPYKKLREIKSPSDLTEYLRFRTYLLAASSNSNRRLISLPLRAKPCLRKMEGISLAQDTSTLAEEVASLSGENKLIETREFSVYYARSGQIPKTLQEIGRLREKTFRVVGEGTGNSIDLDRFDNIYLHLFIWNHEKNELVGANRLGPVDEILPRYGKKGLYTHTLFKYGYRLLAEMGPAMEMGRTFIRESYQKNFSPLLLLWRGIAQYVVQNPHYKILFGAVSISNEYHSYSRQLMVTFLKMNNFLPDLSRLVKPRQPFRQKKIKGLNEGKISLWGNDLEDLSSWISALEADGKGIPVLLKQYIKLSGKILCFNVDTQFGNSLDGLVMVDLTKTDRKVLERYMGQQGFMKFRGFYSNMALQQQESISIDSYAGA